MAVAVFILSVTFPIVGMRSTVSSRAHLSLSVVQPHKIYAKSYFFFQKYIGWKLKLIEIAYMGCTSMYPMHGK